MADLTTPTDTSVSPDEGKSPLRSKTLWTNLVIAICSLFVPVAKDYLQAHPEVLTLVFMGANFFLRAITKQPITVD